MHLPRTKRGCSTRKPVYIAHYSDGEVMKSTPVHPMKSYETAKSKKNRAYLIVVREIIQKHQWFLTQAFDPVARGTNTLKFYSINKVALRECLSDIADRLAKGESVESQEAEDALVAYAEGHPGTIVIGVAKVFATSFSKVLGPKWRRCFRPTAISRC